MSTKRPAAMAEAPCETLASLPQDLQALVLLSVGRKRELQNARRVCSTWRRLMTATWFGAWRNARKQRKDPCHVTELTWEAQTN